MVKEEKRRRKRMIKKYTNEDGIRRSRKRRIRSSVTYSTPKRLSAIPSVLQVYN